MLAIFRISALLSGVIILVSAQLVGKKAGSDEQQIHQVLNTFMNCLHEKDSLKFYSLFHEDPVTWIGVYADSTQQKRIEKDSTLKNYKQSTYKNFYRSMYESNVKEEKFENIKITHDGYIASVTFDYSFWVNGKKGNWGTEHWGMVKINGQWKISSVIYSIELEKVNPQPSARKGG